MQLPVLSSMTSHGARLDTRILARSRNPNYLTSNSSPIIFYSSPSSLSAFDIHIRTFARSLKNNNLSAASFACPHISQHPSLDRSFQRSGIMKCIILSAVSLTKFIDKFRPLCLSFTLKTI